MQCRDGAGSRRKVSLLRNCGPAFPHPLCIILQPKFLGVFWKHYIGDGSECRADLIHPRPRAQSRIKNLPTPPCLANAFCSQDPGKWDATLKLKQGAVSSQQLRKTCPTWDILLGHGNSGKFAVKRSSRGEGTLLPRNSQLDRVSQNGTNPYFRRNWVKSGRSLTLFFLVPMIQMKNCTIGNKKKKCKTGGKEKWGKEKKGKKK